MRYAMLFPGQGSQAVGMLAGLAAPEIEATFREAGDVLGYDMQGLVTAGPAEDLNRTERTQPALLAAGIGVWRAWQNQGAPGPAAFAGHSLGEYTALVAAGSLGFADALRLVELRGRLMQAAVPAGTGGMAAVIGLDDDKAGHLCRAYPGKEVLEPVNFNSPGQVVVAGQTAALEWLEAHGKAHGARMVMRLPVSVPSHCSLMRGAADQLSAELARTTIHEPAIPVLHNLDGQPRREPAAIRQALTEQLYRPVQWTRTVQQLAGQGIHLFLECGPGKVLSGLNKRIDKSLQAVGLEDAEGMARAKALVEGPEAGSTAT
ncbi:MAG TPA: ACP S-malonyltransferase [Solimonas sp.]|nr:ACP S-malonyltransferase [Solimonas sp.]